MIFAFKDYSSNMWEVLKDDGSRMKHYFYSDIKAKELIVSWYGDVEFVQRPSTHPGVIASKQLYVNYYGCSWEGRE
jgi:hypothetical protein